MSASSRSSGVPPSQRVAEVDCGNGIRAALSHYPSRGTQARHRHDFAQVSFLLAGSMEECQGSRNFAMHGLGVGFKPASLWHADRWGRAGALIFSLKLSPDSPEAKEARAGWSAPNDLRWLPALVRLCFSAQVPLERNEVLQDALAFAGQPEIGAGRNPPAWLEAAREQIHDAADVIAIDAAARKAGVHRAHFCRMFIRFYGMPPSVYRRRVAAARAIAAIAASNSSLTDIAHASGFSDQAHLTRTLRCQTGLTPSSLRTMLGAQGSL